MAETLEKVVTNSEAQSAAKALIDHFFRNDGARVSVCIPATDSDTDVVLTRYIKQQAARDLAIGELVKAAEHVVGSKDFIDSRPLMNDLVKALENFKAVSNG